MIKLSFTENRELSEKRKECLEWLGKHRVEVGLTSKASGRSRFLLGIHTRGSPVMRIPPRPVVQPALAQEDLRDEMAGCLAEACGAAFDGNLPGTQKGTLSGGWIYNRVAKTGVPVKGKSGTTPLVDTGQLYNDFDYEITEK